MEGRTVTLVLASPQGALLGQTAPFALDMPFWQEAHDVVRAAQERFGIRVTIVRLLTAERPQPPGGAVVYLAEVDEVPSATISAVPLELARRAQEPSAHRAAWAAFGGHRASLAWVRSVWAKAGAFRAQQHRTWNLSSLWHVHSGEQSAWLKQVPPFSAHEAAVLSWLMAAVPGVSPPVLASDAASGRTLLEHVRGEDCYGAATELKARFALVLHSIQLASIGEVEALAQRGVPDRRGPRMAEHLRRQLQGYLAPVPRVTQFLGDLEAYLRLVSECQLPDVLVHADFHAGNVRFDGSTSTILDWGDSFLGHPGFDLLRLSEGCSDADSASLLQQWSARWRQYRAGCNPERAVALLRALVPLRAAATYAHFVANIEASEHPFHAPDVVTQLDLAERLLGGER